ncbi:hypothetical protein SBOR_4869 [Sclerotinia borealis F-4128]|uniref:2EXR domain-containing protein n=1 Tax=Sclerotinia borealis (strain F-4128) TaxID=1432307 RepID=W9CD98_SCLBF|nr:hypothetical protein SBOR_4869 [Sclerotinia borealis F-4128]
MDRLSYRGRTNDKSTGIQESANTIPHEDDSNLASTARLHEADAAQPEKELTTTCRKPSLPITSNDPDPDSFMLFSKFPLEIRRHVWRHALKGPHLHVISERVATRSRITEIMQTCKEAHEEGIQLNFSYFTFCDYGAWGSDNHHAPLPKHYMNQDADIMWLVGARMTRGLHNLLPCSLSVYDGRCSLRKVKTLAINHELWFNSHSYDQGLNWEGLKSELRNLLVANFRDMPAIRYVVAKPAEIETSFTCIRNQKPINHGPKSLPPFNLDVLPDWLEPLVTNESDDGSLPIDDSTDNYEDNTSDDDVEDEDDLEYDSHADDGDMVGDADGDPDTNLDDRDFLNDPLTYRATDSLNFLNDVLYGNGDGLRHV